MILYELDKNRKRRLLIMLCILFPNIKYIDIRRGKYIKFSQRWRDRWFSNKDLFSISSYIPTILHKLSTLKVGSLDYYPILNKEIHNITISYEMNIIDFLYEELRKIPNLQFGSLYKSKYNKTRKKIIMDDDGKQLTLKDILSDKKSHCIYYDTTKETVDLLKQSSKFYEKYYGSFTDCRKKDI